MTPLDDMLETDEQVVFRTRARPSRLRALAFGLFLFVLFLAAAFAVVALTGETDFWLPMTGAVGGMLLAMAFCLRLQAEIAITDQRILMGGGVIAWLLGIGPKGISIDPSEIDVVTADKSDKYAPINIALHDGRRFDFWVARDNHQFRDRLAEILGRPLRLVDYD